MKCIPASNIILCVIFGILSAVLMAVLSIHPSFGQMPQPIPGDAWFDYAWHDEANIIQRGSLGGERILAQNFAQNNAQNDAQNDAQEQAAGEQETDDGSTPISASPALSDDSSRESEGTSSALPPNPAASSNSLPGDAAERIAAIPEGQSYRISELEIHCEALSFCQEKSHTDALLRATGLRLGHLANARELALSVERLRKTGYFANIHQTVSHADGRIQVSFDTVPHTVIRRIVIDESGSLYESEVKKHMVLRPGAVLYPRTALLRGLDIDSIPKDRLMTMALEDQVKSLTQIYIKQGFFDANVTIEPVEIEENLVDLRVSVSDAESYNLGKIYVRGHHIRTYKEIEDAFHAEFSIFDNLTKNKIEDAVEAVLQKYRDSGYYQTKIEFVTRRVPEKKNVDIFLDIAEAAHWDIQYEGNYSLTDKELNASLTFAKSGYVDRGEVDSSASALKQAYISAGYYWASVSGEMLRGAGDRNNLVVFKINEGERAEIGEISFDGASVFTHEELIGMIGSREYSAFGSGAYPQRSMIADDAAKIVDAYRERGYLKADVPSWTLEPIERGGRLRLTFIIREGNPSRLANRYIRYLDRESFDKFDVRIDEPTTDVFNDANLRAERAAITKQLRARGHATISDTIRCTSYDEEGIVSSEETCEIAEFPAICMPDSIDEMCSLVETRNGTMEKCYRHYETEYNQPGGTECKPTNGITGTEVDVEYDITLGPKFTFGDVFVHGNMVTRDWVVRQDVHFDRGDTFDYNKIIDARSLLRRRTIYKSASLNVIGVDDGLTSQTGSKDSTSATEHLVPMSVNLEEGERRWLDFALGLQETGGSWILTGEMEFVEANLFGTGWSLSFLVMPEARLFTGSEFVFTQKFNQNFFSLLSLSIPVIPSSGFNIVTQVFYDLRYIPDTNKDRSGLLVELQWNISKKLYSALAFELESSKTSSFGIDVSDDISLYHVCYPVTFFQDCPFAPQNSNLTVSLTPRISFEGRDNPAAPKSGVYAEGKVKLAYSDTVGFYIKPEVRASYVFSFFKYFSLAFNGRIGLSFIFENSKLPFVDRFFLGGLNMRGYDNDALGPRLVDSITPGVATNEAGGGEALFNFTAELRFPIWNSIGLYGAVFTDMGSLTEYQPTHYSGGGFFEEMFVSQMRYTAGLGLRWQISEAIPPIIIDYGFILNRRHGDPVGGFSLNVGYTF